MYQSSRVSGQQEEQTVAPKAAPVSPQATPAPGEIRVMKRNGAVVGFDATKIVVAMSKAFWLLKAIPPLPVTESMKPLNG